MQEHRVYTRWLQCHHIHSLRGSAATSHCSRELFLGCSTVHAYCACSDTIHQTNLSADRAAWHTVRLRHTAVLVTQTHCGAVTYDISDLCD